MNTALYCQINEYILDIYIKEKCLKKSLKNASLCHKYLCTLNNNKIKNSKKNICIISLNFISLSLSLSCDNEMN